MDVGERRHAVSDLIHDPFCFCAAGRELTWPTSAFFFSLSFSSSAVLEHSVKSPSPFFFFSFHKSRVSFSLSFAEYNYILFRLNRWDANNKFARIAETLWPTKKISQTRKCYTKKLQRRRFFCGIWIENPPDCDRDSNSGVSLPIVRASWAPESKNPDLFMNQTIKIISPWKEEAANNIQLESLMIFYD